ncbi:MAG: hypothetical protein HXS40_02790, partial [Theionarchaea archaeon]|nr:hypothetical protein [Theionarchaea archaeon]
LERERSLLGKKELIDLKIDEKSFGLTLLVITARMGWGYQKMDISQR